MCPVAAVHVYLLRWLFSFSSLSGWWRCQQWRLHVQLLPVLESPLMYTWPFTAGRCQWPFPNWRQVKSQRLFVWCHGELKGFCLMFFSFLTSAGQPYKTWCFSAERWVKSTLKLLRQHDVTDWQGSVISMRWSVSEPRGGRISRWLWWSKSEIYATHQYHNEV